MLITASKIHDGRSWLPEGAVLDVAEDGVINAVHTQTVGGEVKHYDGILCPGFVNVHCHLELSHMKGAIDEHTGLIPFLQQVMFKRNGFAEEQKQEARWQAYNSMLENGIVAVGDIANTTDTLDLRADGKLHFQTFIESIGFTETPQKQFAYATQTFDAFNAQQAGNKYLSQSIVPHAPYSVSHVLFGLIDKYNSNSLISIHNQESSAEDEYYLLKKGGVRTLLNSIGIDDTFFLPSGKSSLQTYLQWLSPSHPFVFVHNTYTKKADIEVAETLLRDVYWCLCPNANLYIENRLPDIPMFMYAGANICIGTDSLSSNHQLCILSELQSINNAYPVIGWENLLRWGTYNGALALTMDHLVGSLQSGTAPGILQISGIENKERSTIKRLF